MAVRQKARLSSHRSNFSDNFAAFGGGAISFERVAEASAVGSCVFERNQAKAHGGAVAFLLSDGLSFDSTHFRCGS